MDFFNPIMKNNPGGLGVLRCIGYNSVRYFPFLPFFFGQSHWQSLALTLSYTLQGAIPAARSDSLARFFVFVFSPISPSSTLLR